MNEINRVFESLPGYAWRSLADGKLDVVNPGMRRYIGMITEAPRSDWRDYLHPSDRASVDNQTSASETAQIDYPPLRFRRFDGVYRWFQCASQDVHDDGGVLVARCAVAWDIHDALLAAEDLRRKEAAIKAIVDCIPGFVWRLGSEGELSYLNTKAFEYTGKTLEQLREPGWRDSVHPEDVESFIAQWTSALQKTSRIVVEFRLRRYDGTYRWFRTNGEPLLDLQSRVVSWCGVDIDIDDERSAAQRLRLAQAQLARTAQLAIAAELIASTANAINQPLAAIVANAFASQRWLSTSPPIIDRARPILDLIVQDSKQVAAIVKRITTIIKRTPSTNSPLIVNAMIEDVVALLAADLQEYAITIRMHLAEDMPAVNVDPALIQQVLVNLIRNAIDALKFNQRGIKTLYIDSYYSSTELSVEVADNGAGFAEGAPLFEAFYTTRPDGLGLGLAVARSIVDSYGGGSWARHRDPAGAIVGFSLPL